MRPVPVPLDDWSDDGLQLSRQGSEEIVFHRWLTLAARLLRLYIATASPTEQLTQIAQYLVCHYAPMWFAIRSHSICVSGPGNVLRSLQLLRALPAEL